MRLEHNLIYIKDVVLGDVNKVEDGVLTVDVEGLKAAVMTDDKVKDVKVDLAKPGERTRIVPTTKYEQAGDGVVNILKGAAIVTIGDMVGFQEGVIDMWGEGALWTPFSKTFNIVVDITPIDGLDPHQHEVVVRLAGLRASTFVGLAAENAAIDETKVYEIGTMAEEEAKYPDLPKVLYVQMKDEIRILFVF